MVAIESRPEPVSAASMPRRWIRVAVLAGLTLILLYLTFRLALPFLPAFAWGLTLAVVGKPLHDKALERWPEKERTAALVTVILIALVLVAPFVIIANSLYQEVGHAVDFLQKADWQRHHSLDWLRSRVDIEKEFDNVATALRASMTTVVKGTVWSVTQALITLFFLFFFLRDREPILSTIRALLPLSHDEMDQVFARLVSTIRATVSGSLIVATIQGSLGGVMFWLLGLPAPGLWGFVMVLFSVIPMLGAFVVWAPAAVYLALQGSWIKAVILTVWGVGVVSSIDNLLYPMLVGRDVRLHTLPVFVSIVGGVLIFGASGLVLGPVILMLTLALLEIWYHRTIIAEATSVARARGPAEPVAPR
jgi:predicted PurR-regulated permease PerM